MTKKVRRVVTGLALIMPSVLLGVSVFQTHQLRYGFETALAQNQRLLEQNNTLIEMLSASTQEALNEIQDMQVSHGTSNCRK